MNGHTNWQNRKSVFLICFVIGLVLVLLGIALSITIGAKQINLSGLLSGNVQGVELQIIRDLRLPRAICAALVGSFLAASGAIVQGITRNPIASPSIMGVTQGAALAMSIMLAVSPVLGAVGRAGVSFLGAAVSAALIFFLSLKRSNVNVTRMILAGSALGMFFISFASVFALLTNNTKNLGFWLAGGLSGANWAFVRLALVVFAVFIPAAIALSPRITILSLGDDVAVGLGEKPDRVRLLSLIVMVVLSGTAVSIGGNIGFVCLIVPQIARLCIGSDYRYVIPLSAVLGGVLLVFSDVIAKSAIAPLELPLGSITSLIGVPVLIGLVRRLGR